MKQLLLAIFCVLLMESSRAQQQTISRPKLVVGIMIDQMRWDFLYRYYDRYSSTGGFKRMLNQGFTCDNAFIPYAPTVTGAGHACVYTGSVPAINGITGNAWYDRQLKRSVYCTEDSSVKGVGVSGNTGKESPKNMLSNTIGDELRLATNFRSKVIAVSFKDRGSIFPGGHTANGAYWYDGSTGNWITSTYYRPDLPGWIQNLNAKKLPDTYYAKGWNTLYPINTYTQSTGDTQVYESRLFGTQRSFPYSFDQYIGKNYGLFGTTPFGNTFTSDAAKAAIDGEKLGADEFTDLLAISFSQPDYIGHATGPNSIEVEDSYLRLDKDLGDLFNYLDAKVGKGKYLVFLTADHGVAHIPGFLEQNNHPGGTIRMSTFVQPLNAEFKSQFGKDTMIVSLYNHQVHLNEAHMSALNENDRRAVKERIIKYFQQHPGIAQLYDISNPPPLNKKMEAVFANGYYKNRSGDLQIILKPGYIEGIATGTTHGSWNPYDTHIPIVFYGWGVKPGRTTREVYMSDIAPTIAAMLRIQMPNGCVGNVITEIAK